MKHGITIEELTAERQELLRKIHAHNQEYRRLVNRLARMQVEWNELEDMLVSNEVLMEDLERSSGKE